MGSLHNRLIWRFRAPAGYEEVRRIERWLATARVFLAISALVALWMDAGGNRYSIWAFGLTVFYIVHGLVIMLLLRFRQQSTPAFRLLVHAGDVVWPAVISLFGSGQSNPFFLFFVFVLAAAAYRWGLLETVATAAGSVALLWLESLVVRVGWLTHLDHIFASHRIPIFQIQPEDFEPRRLFMRSIYLLVMGLLLGYLAEQQKQLRAEKAVVARVLGQVRVESGLTGTLQAILTDLSTMYGASHAIIASCEANSHHVFTGDLRIGPEGVPTFKWLDVSGADRGIYLFECPVDVGCFERDQDGALSATVLDIAGNRLRNIDCDFMNAFLHRHAFSRVLVVSFLFGREWSGRVFLVDPQSIGDREDELRFLQEMVRQIGPAVYNVYLLRRLRLRAGAAERARFARELHDGAVQSLIAVEMQVDVLRRQSVRAPSVVPEELGRIQMLLREEVLKLRELMQQMKSLDVDSRKLIGFLGDTVERFQRETGISARFLPEVAQVEMPQPVCREVTRIVQEALVNVRKHSQATQVLVRLGSRNRAWHVVIEDDGKGFPFSGYMSHAELDAMAKGPAVIKERVRLIDGQLAIESNPGRGTRLEISVPWKQEQVYGQ